DMLTEAPVGLALFGPDLRFRWVNGALARLVEDAEAVPLSPEIPAVPAVQKPSADPSACHGLLPSEAWPAPVASRAEAALRKVLAEDAPLTEVGYPAVPVSRGPLSADSGPGEESPASPVSSASPAEDVSGCASWFPVHDAGGHVFGVGLIVLNVAGPSAEAAEAA